MSVESHVVFANAGASLVAILVWISGWGLVFAGAATALERRWNSRAVWNGWVAFVMLATIAGAYAFHRSLPGAGSIAGSLYSIAAFIGIPSAAAAWAAIRARRSENTRWIRQVILGFIAFILALPVASVMAALPDIMRMVR